MTELEKMLTEALKEQQRLSEKQYCDYQESHAALQKMFEDTQRENQALWSELESCIGQVGDLNDSVQRLTSLLNRSQIK